MDFAQPNALHSIWQDATGMSGTAVKRGRACPYVDERGSRNVCCGRKPLLVERRLAAYGKCCEVDSWSVWRFEKEPGQRVVVCAIFSRQQNNHLVGLDIPPSPHHRDMLVSCGRLRVILGVTKQ